MTPTATAPATAPASTVTNGVAANSVPALPANPQKTVPQLSFAQVITKTLGAQQESALATLLGSGSGSGSKDTGAKKAKAPDASAAATTSSAAASFLPVMSVTPEPTAATAVPGQTAQTTSSPMTTPMSSNTPAAPLATSASQTTLSITRASTEAVTVKGSPVGAASPAPARELGAESKSIAEDQTTGPQRQGQAASDPPVTASASAPLPNHPKSVSIATQLSSAVAESAARPATDSVVGTAGAKHSVEMKSQGKTEGTARGGEKNLPRGSFLPDAGKAETVGAAHRGTTTPTPAATQTTVSTSAPMSVLDGTGSGKTTAALGSSRVEQASAPQSTRVIHDVTDAVVSFKRTGANSADVSLRPDKGTELSLHLSLNNGQVQVAARLEQGNFDSLNSRWSELQQSLAQQGIRVGHLDHASLNQNAGNNQQNNQATSSQTPSEGFGNGQGHRSAERATDGVEESPLTTSVVTTQRADSSRNMSPVRRGWEMWA